MKRLEDRHIFSGGGGGCAPPRNDLHPPEAFGTTPKSFCTPANYIFFDLIVSYLIILTTRHAGLENKFIHCIFKKITFMKFINFMPLLYILPC